MNDSAKIKVARCHEIQLTIRDKEISRFETIPEIGMAVQLALHIRGLPLIDYDLLKLIATSFLGISRFAIDRIAYLLAEIEFIRIQKSGTKIIAILPTVPYFDQLYEGIGEYMSSEAKPNEFEELALAIVDKLAESPQNIDSLVNLFGGGSELTNVVDVGTRASFLISRRIRGRNILLSPTYFSENVEIFADQVAATGANTVKNTLALIRSAQGWPLSLIESTGEINGTKISKDDLQLIKRLAQDGAVKPPTVTTSHSGENAFIFTPTPTSASITPLRRDLYEKSMAIVAAIRQGQLLPNRYRIRSPGAVLYKLKSELQLAPTSDYAEQYQNLVYLRLAYLEKQDRGFVQLKIIDTPENREALKIAYDLVSDGETSNLSVDPEVTKAFAGDQAYVESLIGSKNMREKETITLSEDNQLQLELLLIGGVS
jgi:hypothetical protein